MRYTALFGHLESESSFKKGQEVFRTDTVGKMGSTGKSNANHLHFGLRKGIHPKLFRMADIVTDDDLLTQAHYFIDNELFDFDYVMTSSWGDPRYTSEGHWIFHKGYDLVPADRHLTTDHFYIHWNRSATGLVLDKGFDPNGYGHYILISYEV